MLTHHTLEIKTREIKSTKNTRIFSPFAKLATKLNQKPKKRAEKTPLFFPRFLFFSHTTEREKKREKERERERERERESRESRESRENNALKRTRGV